MKNDESLIFFGIGQKGVVPANKLQKLNSNNENGEHVNLSQPFRRPHSKTLDEQVTNLDLATILFSKNLFFIFAIRFRPN